MDVAVRKIFLKIMPVAATKKISKIDLAKQDLKPIPREL
jgi:hypothetical protein